MEDDFDWKILEDLDLKILEDLQTHGTMDQKSSLFDRFDDFYNMNNFLPGDQFENASNNITPPSINAPKLLTPPSTYMEFNSYGDNGSEFIPFEANTLPFLPNDLKNEPVLLNSCLRTYDHGFQNMGNFGNTCAQNNFDDFGAKFPNLDDNILLSSPNYSMDMIPYDCKNEHMVNVGNGLNMNDDNMKIVRQNGRSKSLELEFEEIRKYFDVPITQAAKKLNVGLTVLKKRCRELNITRWPHRKIKSLKSLIRNLKELGMTSDIEMLEEDLKRLQMLPELELTEKTKKLRQACFKTNYKNRRSALF